MLHQGDFETQDIVALLKICFAYNKYVVEQRSAIKSAVFETTLLKQKRKETTENEQKQAQYEKDLEHVASMIIFFNQIARLREEAMLAEEFKRKAARETAYANAQIEKSHATSVLPSVEFVKTKQDNERKEIERILHARIEELKKAIAELTQLREEVIVLLNALTILRQALQNATLKDYEETFHYGSGGTQSTFKTTYTGMHTYLMTMQSKHGAQVLTTPNIKLHIADYTVTKLREHLHAVQQQNQAPDLSEIEKQKQAAEIEDQVKEIVSAPEFNQQINHAADKFNSNYEKAQQLERVSESIQAVESHIQMIDSAVNGLTSELANYENRLGNFQRGGTISLSDVKENPESVLQSVPNLISNIRSEIRPVPEIIAQVASTQNIASEPAVAQQPSDIKAEVSPPSSLSKARDLINRLKKQKAANDAVASPVAQNAASEPVVAQQPPPDIKVDAAINADESKLARNVEAPKVEESPASSLQSTRDLISKLRKKQKAVNDETIDSVSAHVTKEESDIKADAQAAAKAMYLTPKREPIVPRNEQNKENAAHPNGAVKATEASNDSAHSAIPPAQTPPSPPAQQEPESPKPKFGM